VGHLEEQNEAPTGKRIAMSSGVRTAKPSAMPSLKPRKAQCHISQQLNLPLSHRLHDQLKTSFGRVNRQLIVSWYLILQLLASALSQSLKSTNKIYTTSTRKPTFLNSMSMNTKAPSAKPSVKVGGVFAQFHKFG
jgi:hypothetical protein